MMDIPREFWARFSDDFTKEAVNPNNPLERVRKYADYETYENWVLGNFAVVFSDGRVEKYGGVMFNADDVEALIKKEEQSK